MGKRLTIALAVLALMPVLLAISAAGYLCLGERVDYQAHLRVSRWCKSIASILNSG